MMPLRTGSLELCEKNQGQENMKGEPIISILLISLLEFYLGFSHCWAI